MTSIKRADKVTAADTINFAGQSGRVTNVAIVNGMVKISTADNTITYDAWEKVAVETPAIQYGAGWNCCKERPAKVVVFDNGARWAVCKSCASAYTGEVQDLPELINATGTAACERIYIVVEMLLGRLYREDSHLHHILTHAVNLSERPTNARQRREHGISRVLYTWLRREYDDLSAMAADIETLAKLGRTERWQTAIRTWAHIARTDPRMFQQYAIYTNYAA